MNVIAALAALAVGYTIGEVRATTRKTAEDHKLLLEECRDPERIAAAQQRLKERQLREGLLGNTEVHAFTAFPSQHANIAN